MSEFPSRTLGELSLRIIQPTEFTREYIEESSRSIPVLRAANVEDGYLSLDDAVFVGESKLRNAKDSFIEPGDILITRTGAKAGATCVVRELPRKFCISSHSIRVIPRKDVVLPEFLEMFLLSQWGKEQITRLFTGAAQKQLQLTSIATVQIPVPPLSLQNALIAEMETAREGRRCKLAQAEALLAGLDGFVLERLGLVVEETPRRGPFAVRLGEARQRCDVDYHSPRFRKLRQSIAQGQYPVTTIGAVCERMSTGFAAGREAQAFDDVQGIPHVRPLNISSFGELHFEGTKYVPRDSVAPADLLTAGEVLFNNTNSTEWVGKSCVFEGEPVCCCSNHITRLFAKRDVANPHFLAALFNALRSTGYFGLLATNFVNQAGINTETLAAVQIPLPDLSAQNKLAAEVEQRREQACRLRAAAAAEWEVAKARFEARLLGEAAQ